MCFEKDDLGTLFYDEGWLKAWLLSDDEIADVYREASYSMAGRGIRSVSMTKILVSLGGVMSV